MAVIRRPYFVVHNGIEHMVEATQPAAAAQHVVGQSITELRPARASEILAWTRAGKPIAVAGQKAEPAAGATATEEDPKWHAGDCAVWLGEQGADVDVTAALAVWQKIVLEGDMSLACFDEMREAFPGFADAIVGVDMKIEGKPATVDAIRAALEEHAMPLASVVELIGEQKRRELYADLPPEGEASETPDPIEAQ